MIRTAIKFGIFGLICLTLTMWLAFVIGNREFNDPLNRDNFELTARFDDVTGLLINDEVKIAGVEVGKVTNVGTDDGRAVVRFQVRNDYRDLLPIDTTASIRWRNLIGQRFLYLVPGEASTTARARRRDLPGVRLRDRLGRRPRRPVQPARPDRRAPSTRARSTSSSRRSPRPSKATPTASARSSTTSPPCRPGLATRDEAISLADREPQHRRRHRHRPRPADPHAARQPRACWPQTFSDNTDVVDQALNEFASFSTDLSTLVDANRAEIDRIIANLDLVVDTEVDAPPRPSSQGALDGLDEVDPGRCSTPAATASGSTRTSSAPRIGPPPARRPPCLLPPNLIASTPRGVGHGQPSAPGFDAGVEQRRPHARRGAREVLPRPQPLRRRHHLGARSSASSPASPSPSACSASSRTPTRSQAVFADAAGLRTGNEVRLAGVKVGAVVRASRSTGPTAGSSSPCRSTRRRRPRRGHRRDRPQHPARRQGRADRRRRRRAAAGLFADMDGERCRRASRSSGPASGCRSTCSS